MTGKFTTALVAGTAYLLAACGAGSAGKTDDNTIPLGDIHRTDITVVTQYTEECGGSEPLVDFETYFGIVRVQDGSKVYGLQFDPLVDHELNLRTDRADVRYAELDPSYTRDSTSTAFPNSIEAKTGEPIKFPEAPELNEHGLSIDNLAEAYAPCVEEPDIGIACKEDGITTIAHKDNCVEVTYQTLVTRGVLSAKGNLE